MTEIKHGRSGNLFVHRPYCLCGELGQYDHGYDAYYCSVSGVWLEDKCDDVGCDICPGRPEKNLIGGESV